MELAQLDIIDVTRCKVSSTCPSGTWPCSNCGTDHPVHDSWVVSFRAEPFRDVRQTLVCDACADDLQHSPRPERREIATAGHYRDDRDLMGRAS